MAELKCRCGEMDTLRGNIKTLETALNRFRTVDRHISSMNTSLSSIAETYTAAFSSEKSAELSSATLGINADLIAIRGKVLTKIQNEKSSMESQLADMKDEDDSYHEEKDKKAQPQAS